MINPKIDRAKLDKLANDFLDYTVVYAKEFINSIDWDDMDTVDAAITALDIARDSFEDIIENHIIRARKAEKLAEWHATNCIVGKSTIQHKA